MVFVSSRTLVGLLQEMIVELRFPLNEAHMNLRCVFSMLFGEFGARSYDGIDGVFPYRYRNKRQSITSIMVFYVLVHYRRIYVLVNMSKVGNRSRGWPEGSAFQ